MILVVIAGFLAGCSTRYTAETIEVSVGSGEILPGANVTYTFERQTPADCCEEERALEEAKARDEKETSSEDVTGGA